MSTTLTAGEQGVMDMYDNEIARVKRYIAQAKTAWIAGTGSYEEIRYQRDKLATLMREQRETLAGYEVTAAMRLV